MFELAADRLRAGRMVRLEFTQLERLVASVRAEATGETYRRLEGLLDTRRRETLDGLLVDDPALHRSRLSWLRQPAVAITPRAILGELDKLAFLRGLGVEGWDVSALSPIGSSFSRSSRPRASVQALARISEERRYPILLCFGAQALVEITDELVDLFDRCLQTATAAPGASSTSCGAPRRARPTRRCACWSERGAVQVELGRILLDPEADPTRKLALVDERRLGTAARRGE